MNLILRCDYNIYPVYFYFLTIYFQLTIDDFLTIYFQLPISDLLTVYLQLGTSSPRLQPQQQKLVGNNVRVNRERGGHCDPPIFLTVTRKTSFALH